MTFDKLQPPRRKTCSVLCLLFLIGACENQERSERWIGHYEAPGLDVEFPIFMELTTRDQLVTGRSVDSSDISTIRGTVVGDRYELLVHPLDQGESTEQDVYFRGIRTDDVIAGEWEHVVGAGGPWTARITELDEDEALDLYRLPCSDEAVAALELRGSCAGGA